MKTRNFAWGSLMKPAWAHSILVVLLSMTCASGIVAGELENRLFEAVKKGDTAVVRSLLAQGADVNARDEDQWTPLHLALSYGQPEAGVLLVAAGANVNARTGSRFTPFHTLAESSWLEGGQLPPGSLQKMAALLIEKGADINARVDDQSKWTPLHAALARGNSALARFLIENGADVNIRENINDWTALHHAASRGDADLVRLLIEKGADVNSGRTEHLNTPLHIAARGRVMRVIKLLIENGADVEATNQEKWTPMQEAAHRSFGEAEALLAFEMGMSDARRQLWKAAIENFDIAYLRTPEAERAPILFNLGLANAKLPGHELEAMGSFLKYLHRLPSADNAEAVRKEVANLNTRAMATLDDLVARMKVLAAQFPDEKQRRRACGYVAVSQAYAGHFLEAKQTANTGDCAGDLISNTNKIVAWLIADCQSRAWDFEEAFQTIRKIDNPFYRSNAVWTLVEQEAQAGQCALANTTIDRALRETAQTGESQYRERIEQARKSAGQCGQQTPDQQWKELENKLGADFDVLEEIAAVTKRDNPEAILRGVAEIADKYYYRLLTVKNLGRCCSNGGPGMRPVLH
jgi:hypothetical protein